jgi:hypothetical protein
MTNAINAIENLNGTPVSLSRFIGCSAIEIINAGIFANDSAEAAAEAKRIYKRDARGMYKKIQADSRSTLRIASKFGLTPTKPYVLIHDANGVALMGILSGELSSIKFFKNAK